MSIRCEVTLGQPRVSQQPSLVILRRPRVSQQPSLVILGRPRVSQQPSLSSTKLCLQGYRRPKKVSLYPYQSSQVHKLPNYGCEFLFCLSRSKLFLGKLKVGNDILRFLYFCLKFLNYRMKFEIFLPSATMNVLFLKFKFINLLLFL